LGDKVAWVSQFGARASGVGTPSPVTEGDTLTVDMTLQVTNVIPDRGGDLSKSERKRVSVKNVMTHFSRFLPIFFERVGSKTYGSYNEECHCCKQGKSARVVHEIQSGHCCSSRKE
jgi:hypothetical protein